MGFIVYSRFSGTTQAPEAVKPLYFSSFRLRQFYPDVQILELLECDFGGGGYLDWTNSNSISIMHL